MRRHLFLPCPFGERGLHGGGFSPSPLWEEGTARRRLFSLAASERGDCTEPSFLPRRFEERGLHEAVFLPCRFGERGLHEAVFSPSPLRREVTARSRLFSLAASEREDCTEPSFLPCGFGERRLHGAVFSPSPLWGEGRGEGYVFRPGKA